MAINHYLDVTFVFVQAERSGHFDSAKLGQFGFGVKDFFGDGKLPSNDKIANFRQLMGAIYDKSGRFSRNPDCYLYYATSGKWNAEKDLVVRAEAETGDLAKTGMFSEVKFVPIGASDIRELYQQTKNSIKREFVFDKKVNVPEVHDVTAAWLGFLPAETLLNLVCDENGEIIKSVFYENVRDYLGPTASVNSEIVATIDDKNKSNRFVLMNNGVTMIAKGLNTTGDKFAVSDFQIVNGCQTSHVLHANKAKLNNQIRVPFRLIHTQDEAVI